jgi:uridine phosphorylase
MNQNVDANILIHPKRGKNEKQLPAVGVLLVNPSEASRCHRQLRQSAGEARPLFNSDLTVAREKSFFVAGPAIGSPMAALSMEKLIALGAKRIILFGWCGALADTLRVGDVVLPLEARSGEGTSRYYPLQGVAAAPSMNLRSYLDRAYSQAHVKVLGGCVWSTDAVYREDKQMLRELHEQQGVSAVDMEFSALCSVALFRNIEFAAVLIVSDELWGKTWRPGFSSEKFLTSKTRALDVLLDVITDLGE